MDEWLNQAQMDSLTADENGMQRTPSQMSLRTESSGGVGDASWSWIFGGNASVFIWNAALLLLF